MPISIGSERIVAGTGSGVFSYSKDGDTWGTYANTTASSTPEVSPTNITQNSLTLSYSSGGTTLFSEDDEYLLVRGTGGLLGFGVRSKVYTLHPRHLGRVLQVSFDYALTGANAGNYSDGDLTLWIIDVTKNTVIQPVSHRIMKAGANVPVKHIATFQTASDGSDFRVAIHCATANTTTLPYNMKISDIKISEPVQSVGAVITDWRSYTPIFQGFGNVTDLNIRWRRVGGSCEIQGIFKPDTTTSVEGRIGLPPGLVISVPTVSTGEPVLMGQMIRDISSVSTVLALHGVNGHTYLRFGFEAVVSNNPFSSINGSSGFSSGEDASFFASVPIQGWGSTVAMSSDTGDGRVVACNYSGNPTLQGGNFVTFGTRQFDTHNAYNTSNGTYTCPVSGVYRISTTFGNTGTGLQVYINRSGVLVAYLFQTPANSSYVTSGSANVICNAGDTLKIAIGGSNALYSSDTTQNISIERISAGTQQIAATETVAASYYSAANQSPLVNQINFGTRLYDTHGAVTTGLNTWKFTAPMSGKYLITGYVSSTAGTQLDLWVNGVLYNALDISDSANGRASYSHTLNLLSGDYIYLRGTAGYGVYGGSFSSNNTSRIEISRIGN